MDKYCKELKQDEKFKYLSTVVKDTGGTVEV